VERDPLAAGRPQGGTGAVRDPEPRLDLEPPALELGQLRLEIVDPVDEQRLLVGAEMLGEQQPRAVGDPDLGDPGPERLDRERDLAAEDLGV
jgi:hypothetical protein